MLFVCAAVLFGTAGPAAAHEGVRLTINSDGKGAVWVTAHWIDGHPVTGQVGMLLTASATTGRQVGPTAMRRTTGAGSDTLTYPGVLPPGEWTTTVEMGTPAIARCQAVLRVADTGVAPVPTQVACEPTTTPPVAAAPPGSSSVLWYVAVGVAALVVVIGIVVYGQMRARAQARARRNRRF